MWHYHFIYHQMERPHENILRLAFVLAKSNLAYARRLTSLARKNSLS